MSTVSFSRALWWVSMFPMRSTSSELSLRRIAGVMFEHEVFRCQILPVLVKCRPGSPDSISDFGRLLQERNHLAQLSHAFSSCQYFDFYVIDFNFFFCVRALVAENFRLFWMNPESHFFSTFLEFAQHFLKLFFGRCKQEHIVGKSQVCEAVMVIVT